MVAWWHGDDDQGLEPRHGDDQGDMVMIRHGRMVMMIRLEPRHGDDHGDMVMIRHGDDQTWWLGDDDQRLEPRHGDDQTWWHGDDDQRLEPRHGDDQTW